MATIGPGGFSPLNLYSPTSAAPLGGGAAAGTFSLSGTGPGGIGYGRQTLGDIDLIMTLLSLLQQGATAPTGINPAATGGPGALAAVGGKGTALAQTGGKAANLRQVGGKGPETLKRVAKK